MSHQDINKIDFYIGNEQQPLKLIELPPEILDSLESSSPPILSISSVPAKITSGQIFLIHGTQKYSMRSKNSSNTILLLQPSPVDKEAASVLSTASVTAIAQCNETIEIVLSNDHLEKNRKRTNNWHDKFAMTR